MENDKPKPSREIIFNQLTINSDLSQPIAAQLAEQLIWLIASGQINPGEKLMGVNELASRLNISLHTVLAAYRYLEKADLVSIKQGRGTIVQDYYTSSFISKKLDYPTHTVGFITPDFSSPFYQEIYQGLQDIANENHFLLLSCGSCENPQLAQEHINMLVAKNVDGLILVSDYLCYIEEMRPSLLGNLDNCPVPIVHIDRPDEKGVSIVFDAEVVGYQATEHLLQHGHTNTGLIVNDRRFPTSRDCFKGYQAALNKHNIPVDMSKIVEAEGFTFEAGYKALETLYTQAKDFPTAIFVSEDTLALAVIRALNDRNMKVPDNVAIIGMNNFKESAYSIPRISSVDTSARMMGVKAMEVVIQMIRGEKVQHRKTIVPSKLVVRESCGCKVMQ